MHTAGRDAAFTIKLFGEPRLARQGVPFALKVPRTALALFGYLAATSDRVHDRQALAYMIWPDETESQARANLRRHLHLIATALRTGNKHDWLNVSARTLQWNEQPDVVIDVAEFKRELRAENDLAAIKCVSGDFLASLDEVWLRPLRAEYREQYLQALLRLIHKSATTSDSERAIQAALSYIQEEPWREDVVRELMSLLAQSGNTAAAIQEYESLSMRLKSDLGVGPSSETLEAARLLRASSVSAPQHDLPVMPQFSTDFVGRHREAEQIKKLLERHRLVTITGFGGMGKTRMALNIAEDVPSGTARFADLSVCDAEFSVSEAIALAFGVDPGGKFQLETILQVGSSVSLLILDNCEHVITSCIPCIHNILTKCRWLKILATSREALHYPAEAVFSMPSLEGADAAILFAKRAACVRPEFQMTDSNLEEILRVCARADGIPLAIEIAAARLSAFSLTTLAQRLAVLPRIHALNDTIDWSYNLLGAEERTVFCALGVFEGGCDIAAAAAIAGSLDVVESLVGKSLVTVEKEGLAERVRLLEPLRVYALERLKRDGSEAVVREKQVSYFATLVADLWDENRAGSVQSWFAQVAPDVSNIRCAFHWARTHGDQHAAMTLAICLGRFGEGRGRLTEGESLLREAAAIARSAEPSAVSAETLHFAATIEDLSENVERSRALNLEALAIRQKIGDRIGMGRSLHNLASGYFLTGNYEEAEDAFASALQIFRALEMTRYISIALDNLGELKSLSGEYEKARTLYDESLRLAQEIRYARGVAWRLSHIGLNEYFSGDLRSAKRHFKEALEHAEAAKDDSAIAETLRGLGRTAAASGEGREAREYLRRSFSMHRDLK
ncbi:MAG: tetratricopeptide repeat protein, partial [Candidatus Baltobacteraceae bacterium]